MSEVLHAFLSYDSEPTKEVYIKRFGVNFKIKAITNDEYYEIREQASYTTGKGSSQTTTINDSELDALLVATGVTDPDFSDTQVIKKFGAKDAQDAVSKSLYVGELKTLQEAILRLSGFDDGEEEIEEAKN
ncbi:phage tail assembly chaperone [Peribacillus huizhouensis]|uniref:Phage portal protein n=1 Tax=Peribacillus huizhouensis TaxID=1501239 RepID=A0ABR6CS08_9BACI|nr:XkdN-like protein [Peribacillus huizhouensis]MBA9027516.1 hypothetical protein [Peribacillus huizhouensis]